MWIGFQRFYNKTSINFYNSKLPNLMPVTDWQKMLQNVTMKIIHVLFVSFFSKSKPPEIPQNISLYSILSVNLTTSHEPYMLFCFILIKQPWHGLANSHRHSEVPVFPWDALNSSTGFSFRRRKLQCDSTQICTGVATNCSYIKETHGKEYM